MNQLLKNRPDVIVGVRGPVIGAEQILKQRDALIWVRARLRDGFWRAFRIVK